MEDRYHEKEHAREAPGIIVCRRAECYDPFQRKGKRMLFTSHTILAVSAGAGVIRVGMNRLEVTVGWFLLLPPGSGLELEQVGTGMKLEWYVFSFDLQAVQGENEAQLYWPACAFRSTEEFLQRPVSELCMQWPRRHEGLAGELRFQGTFNLWLADLWTYMNNDEFKQIEWIQLESDLDRVTAYIHKHYEQKITRQDGVHLSGLSARTFTSKFKQRNHVTFNEYVNRVRMNKAIEKLLLTSSPLSEIARQVGYADEFYLSRKFKQATGLSPTAYVRKPKRYASLDHAYTIDLLTLGVMPCAAVTNEWVSTRFNLPRRADVCEQLSWSIKHEHQLNVLRTVQPDVIIAPAMGIMERDDLQRIAPVIELPWQGIGWRQHFAMVAEITGRTKLAREWIDAFDDKVGKVRLELASRMGRQETVALLNVRADYLLVYASGYMGSDLLYDSLGFAPPPFVADMRRKRVENLFITEEQLSFIDADYIFIVVEENTQARLRSVEIDQLVQRNAARNKQIYKLNMGKWYGYAPAALEAQLDEVILHMLDSRTLRTE
ncbi:helix-turn-helix domain-containing protein [Paenibacillus pinihumi]|uniref:helix-turn-helix domain-containing protein n=1 Tax=Paenibacillus pinihumi TaxID=669462 RepID=UPI00041510C7|nr:AraC family transcriptional regulator [Paenibacillus pinihumi]